MLDSAKRRLHIGDGVKVAMKPNGKRAGKVMVGVVAVQCTDNLIGVARDNRVDFCYAQDIHILIRIADEPQCVCHEDPRGTSWCHGHPLAETANPTG